MQATPSLMDARSQLGRSPAPAASTPPPPLPWVGWGCCSLGWGAVPRLSRPHPACSALVLAFRGAHRKQEEQRRKLEQQVAILEAQQAEELAALEATAQALEQPGCPHPPPPPQLGETLL